MIKLLAEAIHCGGTFHRDSLSGWESVFLSAAVGIEVNIFFYCLFYLTPLVTKESMTKYIL